MVIYVYTYWILCSWVVVLPSGSRKPTKPYKLELAMYSSLQVLTIIICDSNVE